MATRDENRDRRALVRRLRAKRWHTSEIAKILSVSGSTVLRDLHAIRAEAAKEHSEETRDDFWQLASDTFDEVIRGADKMVRQETENLPEDRKPNTCAVIGALRLISETQVQQAKLAQELGIVPSAPQQLEVGGSLLVAGVTPDRVKSMSTSELTELAGRLLARSGGASDEGEGDGSV